MGIEGSGWAVLGYEPIGGNLVIEQFYDQQNGVPVATIPLFQLDMWEHAFYLDYQNVKADYVEDRKSTRLNSSHVAISYAVFCLKKKKLQRKLRRAASQNENNSSDQTRR